MGYDSLGLVKTEVELIRQSDGEVRLCDADTEGIQHFNIGGTLGVVNISYSIFVY